MINNPIKLTLQLHTITSKRDSGGRIVFDYGADSLEGIIELQKLLAIGDMNLAAVLVPFTEDLNTDEMKVNPVTGEIEI